MSQIRITPQQLYDGSKFVSQKAEIIETELKSLKSKIDEIASNWEGDSQNAFVASFDELYSSFMSKFPEITRGVAEQMHKVGEIHEKADVDSANAMRR